MTTAMIRSTEAPIHVTRNSPHKSKEKSKSKVKAIVTGCMIPVLVLAVYVLSVITRVSVYEQKVFGRSTLIPMSLNPRRFSDIPTMDTYGAFTYNIDFEGKPLRVHRQTINGYQHTFGSALVASELGSEFSDLLFRMNEYVEAYAWHDGARMSHILDTRKDLYNNAVGREIAERGLAKHLTGDELEDFLSTETLKAIRTRKVISHWLDAEVQKLPTSAQYGCPGLPGPINESH